MEADDDQTKHLTREIEDEIPGTAVIDNEEEKEPLKGHKRYIPLICFSLCFYVGCIGAFLLLPQYIRAHLMEEANITDPSASNNTQCTINKSDPNYIMTQKMQAKSSTLLAEATFSGAVPSVLTVFLYGAFSDSLGRKLVISIPYIGLLLVNTALTLVINLDFPFFIYIIAMFVNGMTGSFPTMLAGSFAYVADVTTMEQRSLAIGIMESSLGISVVITNLIVGWWIRLSGYGIPMIGLTSLSAVSIVFLCCLKETRQNANRVAANGESSSHGLLFRIKSELRGFKRLLQHSRRRSACLMLLVISFTLFEISYIGTAGSTTLYLMDLPFCWGSVELGYFNAIRTFVRISGGFLILAVFRKRLQDTTLAFLGIVVYIIDCIFEGMASLYGKPYCNILMVAGAGIAFMANLAPIMMRTMGSKLVSVNEQGAMFGLLAMGEAFAFSFGPAILSVLYANTVAFSKGFIFFICAGLLLIVTALMLAFKILSRRLAEYSSLDNVVND